MDRGVKQGGSVFPSTTSDCEESPHFTSLGTRGERPRRPTDTKLLSCSGFPGRRLKHVTRTRPHPPVCVQTSLDDLHNESAVNAKKLVVILYCLRGHDEELRLRVPYRPGVPRYKPAEQKPLPPRYFPLVFPAIFGWLAVCIQKRQRRRTN